MKPIINRLTGYTTLVFMPFLLLKRKHLVWLLVAIITAGCFQKYYSTGSTKEISQDKISLLMKSNKVFILHFENDKTVFMAENMRVANDTLTGDTKPVDEAHRKALSPSKKSNVVPGKNLPDVLNEVHVYTSGAIDLQTTKFAIPVTSVYRMDVYEFDEKSTKRSTITSVIGIVAVVAIVVIVVAAASADYGFAVGSATTAGAGCGCPEVFMEQHGQFQYLNGVFSGALYSNLERSDYLPLGDIAVNNGVQLQIRNTPNEQQFLNQVELVAVRHQPGEYVLADRKGHFFGYSGSTAPVSAKDETGLDISPLVAANDGQLFRFDADLGDKDLSSLVLEFNVPAGTVSPVLLVTGRNTNWAASMNQSFTQLFGDEYPAWRARKEKEQPEDMEKWQIDQGLPIKVFVAEGNGWKFLDHLPLAGTMASRDMAIKLDIPVPANGKLTLKLETVFNFWEIDKLSIASGREIAAARKLLPDTSSPEIRNTDGQYLTLDEKNTPVVSLHFADPAFEDGTAYFLHARGYYHNEYTYPGKADRETLRNFRDGNAFSDFSKSQYRMYRDFMAARPK